MVSPYAPPESPPTSSGPDEYPISLPGVSAQVVVTVSGVLGKRDVLVNGAPAGKKFPGKRLIPKDDGGSLEARLVEGLTGLDLVVGKRKIPVGPRISVGFGLLAYLPLGLVFVGGAIGGLVGASGMLLNRKIAYSSMSTIAKVASMLGVFAATTMLFILVAGAVQVAAGRVGS